MNFYLKLALIVMLLPSMALSEDAASKKWKALKKLSPQAKKGEILKTPADYISMGQGQLSLHIEVKGKSKPFKGFSKEELHADLLLDSDHLVPVAKIIWKIDDLKKTFPGRHRFIDALISWSDKKGWVNHEKGTIYLFFAHDHHHEAAAVQRAYRKGWINSNRIAVKVTHDLGEAPVRSSLEYLIRNNLMLPLKNYKVLPFMGFPLNIKKATDESYRGIVWVLIQEGYLEKEPVDFFEFRVGKYLSENMKSDIYDDRGNLSDKAKKEAIHLMKALKAQGKSAKNLPPPLIVCNKMFKEFFKVRR